MAALFPPWSDTAFRVGLGALLLGGLGALVAPMIYVRTPFNQGRGFPVDQPLPFDHRHHVVDDGIDCRFCHDLAETSPYAGLPSTELCMGCHSQIWRASPALAVLRRSAFSGLPVTWNRVHALPGFAYFDHSIHLKKGIGCETCHGRVDRMPLDWQVAPLTMGWCLDCHRDPAPRLRPPARVTAMGFEAGGDRRAAGDALARRLGVRKLTACTTCHR